MNCPNCETEMIWGSDFDIDDDLENQCVLSCWHCPDCPTEVEVYSYAEPI